MHLLAAAPGAIDDGSEPFDLGQTPADIVVISAADTELAALSQARQDLEFGKSLRLANLTHLGHPMSVDMHLDDCTMKSRLVIARVLGGRGYWTYGLEQYAARLREAGVPFVALPGDDKPDEELRSFSTVSEEDYTALWSYLIEGGPENAQNFLTYAAAMLDGVNKPAAAKPLLRAGLYWPGMIDPSLGSLKDVWTEGAPIVPLVFYRALVQGAGLHPINRLAAALSRAGLNPMPIFVASLKDPVSVATLHSLFADAPPDVILNCTSFAVGTPDKPGDNPLAAEPANGAPVFQIVLSASSEAAWEENLNGLSARDIAMNVALPEVDGRVLTRAVSFKGEAYYDEATECPIATYMARGDRIAFVAELAKHWAQLRRTDVSDKKVALVLANYPNKDGRLANGVGLDTPAATVGVLKRLAEDGLSVSDLPSDSDTLMRAIMAGPTNWLTDRADRKGGERLSLETYQEYYQALSHDLKLALEERWGAPEDDPFYADGAFALSILKYRNAVVGVQPARGYNIDPKDTYHAPDLVPPHNYLAFYFWLRHEFGAQAIVHMGKHGNLEWLPGKAVALSQDCWPEAILGPTPHLYPFIVNDPGEGTQAKRRTQAVIIDHLTPPMTRAETYGPLKDLEALVDEYYDAAGVDPRRLDHLRKEILSLTTVTGLDADLGFDGKDADGDLAKLDEYLCELKEAQIRDGLHIFGTAPDGRLKRDLVQALLRTPRGDGEGENAALPRAIAADLELGFDPLDCAMGETWTGPKPDMLASVSDDPWRTNGDTVERIELLSGKILDGEVAFDGPTTHPLTHKTSLVVQSHVEACGAAEMDALMTGLAGQFVPPGPSGAPTRGRLDVLPTGRNFFSVDSRA
ncbi:MAG: cobaltochelatase subunit CobN, partial [Pseudomonadota bacterium]